MHKHIPYGNNVANASGKDEEMKDGMHESPFAKTIEERAGYVADSFGDNPNNSSGTDAIDERLKGNEYREAHENGLSAGQSWR